MTSLRAVAIFASTVLLWGATTTSAAVVSIDLGSEFLRVCLVKHGRNPISVVVNEMSRRKSPALVGFVNGERLLGEEAFGMGVRYPETIYTRARDLLGKAPDDPSIAAMMKNNLLPYEVVRDGSRNVAALRVDANTTVSAEELVVSCKGSCGCSGEDMLLSAFGMVECTTLIAFHIHCGPVNIEQSPSGCIHSYPQKFVSGSSQ